MQGNIADHEYEIEADEGKIAEVSKKWFRARDTYGVRSLPARTRRCCWPSLSPSTPWPTPGATPFLHSLVVVIVVVVEQAGLLGPGRRWRGRS